VAAKSRSLFSKEFLQGAQLPDGVGNVRRVNNVNLLARPLRAEQGIRTPQSHTARQFLTPEFSF
jgi:hypothetical protein